MDSTLSGVLPINRIAPYLSGKRNLSRRLCALIATIPHRTFVDVFVGMDGVFLRRASRPPVEVINDISADVTTLTDIERPGRFLVLQRLSFGGKVPSRTFGIDHRSPGRLNVASLRGDLRALRDRLERVTIERFPYGEVISRYDRAETLFYLDPPYWVVRTTMRGRVRTRRLRAPGGPAIRHRCSFHDIDQCDAERAGSVQPLPRGGGRCHLHDQRGGGGGQGDASQGTDRPGPGKEAITTEAPLRLL